MYPVSSNTAHLTGASESDRVSPFRDEARSPRPETERDGGRPVRLPVDEVRLSEEARRAIASKPVEPKPHPTPLVGDPLTTAARKTNEFLGSHSRIAESSFGKAATNLIRGVAQLSKAQSVELSDEAKKALDEAVEDVKEFLGAHPRIENSSFGESVAGMARGISVQIESDTGNSGLKEAAREAQGFLDDHPRIAKMPLGEAVGKLVNGVAAQADAAKIDDLEAIQKLAKRIGTFVENHPRLSESEFGDIVKDLVREIVVAEEAATEDAEKEPEVGEYLVDPNNMENKDEDKIDLAFV